MNQPTTPPPAPTTTPAAVHPDAALAGVGVHPPQPLTHVNLHRRTTINAERALWAYNEQHERARL
jgi:hypothetical protein